MRRRILITLLLMAMTLPLVAASRRAPNPFAVPSRYLITRTGGSGTGTVVYPMRWPSGSTINFFLRGSQPGAINGGLNAFSAAANAWTNDPDSNITILYGGTTTNDALFTDGVSSIQFNDPDNQIAGSYSVGSITGTGDLTVARMNHAAILLGDGSVLLTGGTDGLNALPSAELYSNGTFAPTNGAMTAARQWHTMTLLQTGEVLVAGGWNGTAAVASADIFDPNTGTFPAAANPLNTARFNHTATALPDQTILFAGGESASGRLASAELYDQTNQTFTATGSMASARTQHTATQYGSTFVLVAGGRDDPNYLASAEIFDTDAGSFSATASPLNTARSQHTATKTTQGIVIIGGLNADGPVGTAEYFRENDDRFVEAPGTMITPRYGHQATLLADDTILITGGFNAQGAVDTTEVFNPDTGVFAPLTLQMTTARALHTATKLADGKILIAGGMAGTSQNSADLCDPPSSVRLGFVNLYTDFTTYTFPAVGGETMWTITEADIVLQDGLPTSFTSGAGFDQLIANLLGFALGFGATTDPATLNPVFDINAPSPGATLQAYDAGALAAVYPTCPAVTGQSDSVMIASGQTTTLSVDATGGDLTYQWYQGAAPDTGTPVGTSAPDYTTPALTAQTQYWVRVSNNCGHDDSTTFTITIGVKGDANGDNVVNGADVVALINQLLGNGGTPPASADADGDGNVTMADVFYLINFLFGGGAAPV